MATKNLQKTEQILSTLLASHQMPIPATFSFEHYDVPFDVGVRRGPDGGAQLVVRSRLGNLPFSAESIDVRNLLHSVITVGDTLPMMEINLDRKQAIVVRGTMTFRSVPSPAVVAAGTAAITIVLKPICELVARCHQRMSQRKIWSQSA